MNRAIRGSAGLLRRMAGITLVCLAGLAFLGAAKMGMDERAGQIAGYLEALVLVLMILGAWFFRFPESQPSSRKGRAGLLGFLGKHRNWYLVRLLFAFVVFEIFLIVVSIAVHFFDSAG